VKPLQEQKWECPWLTGNNPHTVKSVACLQDNYGELTYGGQGTAACSSLCRATLDAIIKEDVEKKIVHIYLEIYCQMADEGATLL
jgi:hypothetical protein